MCGRFYIDEGDEQYRAFLARLDAQDTDDSPKPSLASGEIFPTDVSLALIASGPCRMGWGFSRYDGKGRVINARAETLLEKPMFLGPMHNGRCLIPATGYFEWEHVGTKKRRYRLWPEDGGLCCFAALSRAEPGALLPLFTIITMPAAEGIRFVHERMPVILPPEVREAWLRCKDPAAAAQALQSAERRICCAPCG